MKDLKHSEETIEKLGQEFIDKFKNKMKKAAEEVLGEVYCDLMPHIEGDSWTNYRNYLQEGFKSGWKQKDFRDEFHEDLRRTIFLEHKDELIGLLNQDLVKRVQRLENELQKQYERYF